MENITNNSIPVQAPVCQVCKKSDETLRLVSYPYVVSVVVMTFQRAFSGIFCAKHQRRYHVLASLITSVAGWLGIPFGFILTPIALLKLARGGVTNDIQNVQLLNVIADKKMSEGDTQGAIRCLEECIRLQDVLEIRTKLARLYQIHRPAATDSGFESTWQFISVPTLIILSSLTGLLIGLFDLLLGTLLSPLYEQNGSNLFVAIASWLPTVTMLFSGVLIVRALLRWCLSKNEGISMLLGSLLAYASTFFAFYSVLQGQALVRNVYGVLMFFGISRRDGFFALRSVLAHGGGDVLINNFSQTEELPGLIFAILLIAAIGLSILVSLEMVIQKVKGQQRLLQIRTSLSMETEKTPLFAWGTLIAMLLGFILFVALAFPGKYVNVESVQWEVNQGITELEQSHVNKAVEHFRAIEATWPDSVTNHVYVGMGYGAQNKYDQAIEEFDKGLKLDANSVAAHYFKAYVLTGQFKLDEAVQEYKFVMKAQPTWGSPHAELAVLYYTMNNTNQEKQEIQQALVLGNTDGQTYSSIASYYLITQQFDKAEEYYLKSIQISKQPSGGDYLLLARAHICQGDFDQSESAIKEAERLGANPINIYIAKIHLAEFRNQFDRAAALIAEALKAYPDDSELYGEKSFLEFRLDHVDTAASDAEKALKLDPYNSQAYVELAFAYHAQGKLTEATEMARKAVATAPKYDRAYYILGLCHMDMGMKEEAREEFESFLKLYWERPLVKEYKEKVTTYLEQLK